MKTYIMLYGYNDGRTDSKILHFHNDLIAMVEAPMFAIAYDYWMLTTEDYSKCITRYMPTWGDTKIVRGE